MLLLPSRLGLSSLIPFSVLLPFIPCVCRGSKLLTAAIFPSTVAGEHEEDAADGRRGTALVLRRHY